MRRASVLFLAVFVIAVLGLGGMIAWTARGKRVAAPPEPAPQADYRINEVHLSETLEGNLRFTLDADRAEVFDKTQETVLRNVVVRIFGRQGVWTVTGEEGLLHNDRRDVTLRGNVVLSAEDGLRLTTSALNWQNQARLLFTEEAVAITRAGTTITGRGLRVSMAEELATLDGSVRVVITDRRNANLALFPRSGS